MNLSKNCSRGTVVHEILHALGFRHEHQRNDRDQHLTVLTKHILPEGRDNFEEYKSGMSSYGTSYDYNSIMHYGAEGFGTERTDFPTQQVMQLPNIAGSSVPHLFLATTGRAEFWRVDLTTKSTALGFVAKTGQALPISRDNHYYAGYEIKGKPHFIQYNFITGKARMCRADKGKVFDPGRSADVDAYTKAHLRSETQWEKRFTQIVPYLFGSHTWLLCYAYGSGYFRWKRISQSGLKYTDFASGKWGSGWDSFFSFEIAGHPYVFRYNSKSGRYQFGKIKAAGYGFTIFDKSGRWATGWKIRPYVRKGRTHMLLYNLRTLSYSLKRIDASGKGATVLRKGKLPKDLLSLVPFVRDDDTFLLAKARGNHFAFLNLRLKGYPAFRTLWEDGMTTLETKHEIGQRDGLSEAGIYALKAMYG
ncbi:MAG: M12 family metallopeptidase [Pseudomonadota bacterium]